jgi:hypothetical protein
MTDSIGSRIVENTRPYVAIVALSVLSAVAYGIIHDQVTARICVEYFTIGHPPVFGTDSPTLLALGWGVYATWWVGLILGVPLAIAARAGSRPKRSPGSLIRPIGMLLGAMALCALVAGGMGYLLARTGRIVLIGPVSQRLPPEKHVPYLADLWAHSTSYLVGCVGGLAVILRVWKSRRNGPSVSFSRF